MSYPESVAQWLGLPLPGIVVTILATCAIYAVFVVVSRVLGPRMIASLSTYDTLMALLFGSVVARTMLGPVPTLTTGITVLATLTALHLTLGRFANTRRGDRVLNSQPVLLMTGATIVEANLHATHTTHRELASTLRLHGIVDPAQVGAVIMEPSGKLSVLGRTHAFNPELFTDVRDYELIDPQLFRGDTPQPESQR